MQIPLFLISLLFLLPSCGSTAQSAMSESKYKDTPTAHALLERFKAQEHRLEINDCELVYNDKSFFLGTSELELSKIIGKNPDFTEGYARGWTALNLWVGLDADSGLITSATIYLSQPYDEGYAINDEVILLSGAPMVRDRLFGEFIASSHFEFEDFNIGRYSFTLEPETCGKQPVKIDVGSAPVFKSRSAGHLTVTGEFDPSKSAPVETISVFYRRK